MFSVVYSNPFTRLINNPSNLIRFDSVFFYMFSLYIYFVPFNVAFSTWISHLKSICLLSSIVWITLWWTNGVVHRLSCDFHWLEKTHISTHSLHSVIWLGRTGGMIPRRAFISTELGMIAVAASHHNWQEKLLLLSFLWALAVCMYTRPLTNLLQNIEQ